MKALKTLQRHFPLVEEVVDSTKTIKISVIDSDSKRGTKKDPYSCALARACIRQKIADGAIIGIGYSYLIKGRKATRYKTSVGVSREITSFDRHQDFREGNDYILSKISPTNRFDRDRSKEKHTGSHPERIIHKTSGIRILRGKL